MKLESDKLDPDSSLPPYMQLANMLRAAIRTEVYAPGQRLPSAHELAETYGVARMTAQNATRVLREAGLVVTRHGSGTFVREQTQRPIGLRPHIERAFAAQHVSLDFSGFSGETLYSALQEPIDKIRAGRLTPETISVRILLPDMTVPVAVPCRTKDLQDDPEFRERAQDIASRYTGGIIEAVQKLEMLELVRKSRAHVKVHNFVPIFKLYILNDSEVFFGYYPIERNNIKIKGRNHSVFDLMGRNTKLFHYSDDNSETGKEHVEQAKIWFNSVWNNISHDGDV